MARLLLEHGWYMGTHFISHDTRMTRETWGPYSIGSTLPMRYYDYDEGLLDFYLQPAQYDESEAIGSNLPYMGDGRGFTQKEYADRMERFMRESCEVHHGVQIANFHPVYLDPAHPRTSHACFLRVIEVAHKLDIPIWELEGWCSFVRGRDAVRIVRIDRTDISTRVEMEAALQVDGLTVLLDGASASTSARLGGRRLTVHTGKLEGKRQRYVVISLAAAERAVLDVIRHG
jgi:hypothetical protein